METGLRPVRGVQRRVVALADTNPAELRSAARTRASGPTYSTRGLLAVLSTSTKYVQHTEICNCTRMPGGAGILTDVPINSHSFAQVQFFSQMHSHVKQGSDEVVGTGGYKKLRVQAKPVLLEHSPQSGPNRVLVEFGAEQITEMEPAAETPVWARPPHHYSVATQSDAIVEAVRVRGVSPGFGFEECSMKIPPIDAQIAVVIGRLKAQAVGADSRTRVWRHLTMTYSAQEEDGRDQLWKGSHL